MKIWDQYPETYRLEEINKISRVISAGASALVLGLSGSGKSNFLGFLTHRVPIPGTAFFLLDCNRIQGNDLPAFWQLIGDEFGCSGTFHAIKKHINTVFNSEIDRVCICFDRFDALSSNILPYVNGALRSLRDDFKYQLSFIIGSRKPIELSNELAELFFGNEFWLGALNPTDAQWSINSFAARINQIWEPAIVQQIIQLSSGYPSLLRGICEAYAQGCPLDVSAIQSSNPVRKRIEEFWLDHPSTECLKKSGLEENPILSTSPSDPELLNLTAKEALLLNVLKSQSGILVEKDALIQAVWPEDKIFSAGVRDDSLAQLVKRLRQKVGSQRILTITGRGYKWID